MGEISKNIPYERPTDKLEREQRQSPRSDQSSRPRHADHTSQQKRPGEQLGGADGVCQGKVGELARAGKGKKIFQENLRAYGEPDVSQPLYVIVRQTDLWRHKQAVENDKAHLELPIVRVKKVGRVAAECDKAQDEKRGEIDREGMQRKPRQASDRQGFKCRRRNDGDGKQ